MHLGVQLYAFEKEHILNKPDYIFRHLAEMGYQAIEMPFMMDVHPYTKEYGLQYSALHTGPDALKDLPRLISHLQLNDCQNLCISGPLAWHDRSLGNFQKTCVFLNEQAALLKPEGIKIHYHNHDFEFKCAENKVSPFDILLEQLDPSLIQLCVDTGWLHMIGLDPVTFLKQYRDRISYAHLRDFLNGKSVALGQGSVDVASIVHELRENALLEWLVVEHEPEPAALEKLSVSRSYLKTKLLL
ncbi:sugar phosphate isomerase/epimerase family protein [Photobacterium swingsii]|nr:sugar phosphate isomerase/epimerase [Photobacterium swingsii]